MHKGRCIFIRNVKIKLFIVGVISFFVMTISGIYAISSNIIFTSENMFSTDSINIDLIEYMKTNDNSENLYDNKKRIVFPGNNVSLIPKVINLGANCYIRAKVTFEADKDILNNESNYIFDISSKWKKIR